MKLLIEEPVVDIIENLKREGVTLNDIHNELDYRDRASCENKWDDNLYEYSTEELQEIEVKWEELK